MIAIASSREIVPRRRGNEGRGTERGMVLSGALCYLYYSNLCYAICAQKKGEESEGKMVGSCPVRCPMLIILQLPKVMPRILHG
jgi:hypothetical protein